MVFLNRYFPWVAWPFGIVLSITVFFGLQTSGLSAQVSAYAAIIIGAAIITLFEIWFPARGVWKPRSRDVGNDLLYMATVQVILPLLLVFFVAITLLRFVGTLGLPLATIWPHGWPRGVQVTLMVLAADLMRYWLHVFAHKNPTLWQLHAVHHSPKRLYWVNTGRFHPLEEALQFLLDALPFILMDVGENVLSLYFVFYAVNGFFQHSNIRLRFGFLNYIISSAELHRWHHSRVVGEANNNYGNNVIIWDLLFGTWYLPSDKEVAELGLQNENYPDSYVDQMRMPFIPGIADEDMPPYKSKDVAKNIVLRSRMVWFGLQYWKPVVKAARQPLRTQNDVLRGILRRNADSPFGREHGFKSVRNVAEFRERVAVHTYDTLKPYIDKQIETGEPQLSTASPILYARTSGTGGDPKFLPMTAETIRQLRRSMRLFLYVQRRCAPNALDGRLLAITSPAVEGYFKSGVPYGSTSGFIYSRTPHMLKSKYVVPWQVFDLEDYRLKYLLVLRLALAERYVTYSATANPSTYLMLDSLMRENFDLLVSDIAKGEFSLDEQLPDHVRSAIAPRLARNPERARQLESLAHNGIEFKNIWPYLSLLATWTGGSCGLALKRLKPLLSERTRIIELGYLSSEFRGTVTVDPDSNAGLPTLQENFFEFVERQNWENGVEEFLTVDELEDGRQYHVFVTTVAGLYRYFMNDIIEVDGRFEATPLIRFLQKGRGVTNITGEKLYENQVLSAVRSCEDEAGVTAAFFLMIADPEAFTYRLFFEIDGASEGFDIDAFCERVDRRLCDLSVEYSAKRASGRLTAVTGQMLKTGTGAKYRHHCVERGQREGQLKIMPLQYKDQVAFDLDNHLAS